MLLVVFVKLGVNAIAYGVQNGCYVVMDEKGGDWSSVLD